MNRILTSLAFIYFLLAVAFEIAAFINANYWMPAACMFSFSAIFLAARDIFKRTI